MATTGLSIGAAFVLGVLLTLVIVRRSAGYRFEYRRLLITSDGKERHTMSTTEEPQRPEGSEPPDEHEAYRGGQAVPPDELPEPEVPDEDEDERERQRRERDDQAPA